MSTYQELGYDKVFVALDGTEAQQKVLAADIAVAQRLRRLLRLFDGGLRPRGKPIVLVHSCVAPFPVRPRLRRTVVSS